MTIKYSSPRFELDLHDLTDIYGGLIMTNFAPIERIQMGHLIQKGCWSWSGFYCMSLVAINLSPPRRSLGPTSLFPAGRQEKD